MLLNQVSYKSNEAEPWVDSLPPHWPHFLGEAVGVK